MIIRPIKPDYSSNGFTLVESLVAITILMIAIAGPLTVANKAYTSALDARNEVIGYNLAQEALELASNYKDNNISSTNPPSSSPLPTGVSCTSSAPCGIGIDPTNPVGYSVDSCSILNSCNLTLLHGTYLYGSGQATPFEQDFLPDFGRLAIYGDCRCLMEYWFYKQSSRVAGIVQRGHEIIESNKIMIKFMIKRNNEGYALLFAVILASVVLAIAAFILGISRKEFILASASKDSMISIYAADSGIQCMADAIFNQSFATTSTSYTCDGGSYTASFSQVAPSYVDSTMKLSTGDAVYQATLTNIGFNQGCVSIVVTNGYDSTDLSHKTIIDSSGYNVGNASTCPDSNNPRLEQRTIRLIYKQ